MTIENNILTLIKVITALYFDSMAEDKAPNVQDELRAVIESMKVENNNSSLGTEDAAVDALRYTAEWMLSSTDEKYTRDGVIQRLTVNLHCDNNYIEIAKDSLDESITSIDARKRVDEILSEMRFEKRQQKVKSLIGNANRRLNFNHEFVNTADFIHGLVNDLEDLGTASDGEAPGFVGRIDFNNPDTIEEVLYKSREMSSEEGILKTGLQGLTKACGLEGGIRRGALVNFGALTHNYKSGILIDLAMNIPICNDPYMMDETKKPLILRISFENTIEQDISIMYKKLYEMKYGKRCNIAEINTAEAAKELAEHFAQRGYEFQLLSYDPNNFSVYDLFDVLNNIMAQGYEIHACSCDYLTQIAHNTIGDRTDQRIQKTYEMVRNFCYPKGITFLTAHQLSTEAQGLSRDSTATFTKKVCTGGWYMDCKSLHTKLDLEFVMHIHQHQDGEKYLMFSRGKHRGGENTPIVDQHFCYQFQTFGGIIPDFEGEPQFFRKLPEVLEVADLAVWD